MTGFFTPSRPRWPRGAMSIVMATVRAAGSVSASGEAGAIRGVDGSGSMRQMRRFVIVAVAGAMFAAAGCTAAPGREQADQAWSQRLTQQAASVQAEAARQERLQAAWSARLSEQAQAYVVEQRHVERANGAWSSRLTNLADHLASGGASSDRASKAWSDRLNGLAESVGAID